MKLLTTVPFSGFYETMHSDAINYLEYAKAYVDQMSTGLEFDSLDSPREYNFATDRIFTKIDVKNVKAMLDSVDKETFDRVCTEHFTSYAGFISGYDCNWEEWGNVIDWDHNQIGALLEAFLDEDIEEQIYDHLRGNGFIEFNDEE